MKKINLVVLFSSAVSVALFSSCSATKGLGQDLQKVGSRMERQADATGGTAPEPAQSAPLPYSY